jgi:hypothetical protein
MALYCRRLNLRTSSEKSPDRCWMQHGWCASTDYRGSTRNSPHFHVTVCGVSRPNRLMQTVFPPNSHLSPVVLKNTSYRRNSQPVKVWIYWGWVNYTLCFVIHCTFHSSMAWELNQSASRCPRYRYCSLPSYTRVSQIYIHVYQN